MTYTEPDVARRWEDLYRPDVARKWEDLYMAAAKDNIKLAERIGKLEAELTVKGFEIERLRTLADYRQAKLERRIEDYDRRRWPRETPDRRS